MPVGLGCSIWCEGHPACDRLGSLSLYARDMQLVKIPPDVKHIAKTLEAVTKSFISQEEAAQLLHCSEERILQLCRMCKDQTDEYKRELRQQVFALTGKLVDGKIVAPPSTRQRKAKVGKLDLQFLDAMEDQLKTLGYEPRRDTWIQNGSDETLKGPCTSENLPDAASARGPLSRSEYFHGKKWPQISWFLGRLKAMQREGQRFQHILDVGGGRGDLAIHIACALGLKVTVIDTNESSLQAGRDAAHSLKTSQTDGENLSQLIHFQNMDFNVAAEQLPHDIDLVVALHACGGLSDAALGFAASRQIGFMICPCCHLKHPHLEPKDGWSSLCDDSNANQILRRLAEIDRQDISCRALYIIAALRLQAVKRSEAGRCIDCRLATFAQEYSLRTELVVQISCTRHCPRELVEIIIRSRCLASGISYPPGEDSCNNLVSPLQSQHITTKKCQ